MDALDGVQLGAVEVALVGAVLEKKVVVDVRCHLVPGGEEVVPAMLLIFPGGPGGVCGKWCDGGFCGMVQISGVLCKC